MYRQGCSSEPFVCAASDVSRQASAIYKCYLRILVHPHSQATNCQWCTAGLCLWTSTRSQHKILQAYKILIWPLTTNASASTAEEPAVHIENPLQDVGWNDTWRSHIETVPMMHQNSFQSRACDDNENLSCSSYEYQRLHYEASRFPSPLSVGQHQPHYQWQKTSAASHKPAD